jgi:hypothetical protein
MDDKERYKRERDLLFQEMEEKAMLQKQAIAGERAETLLSKMGISRVEPSVISGMMDAGRKFPEIIEFLDSEILENAVRSLMAARSNW